jgi:hypothetical protein
MATRAFLVVCLNEALSRPDQSFSGQFFWRRGVAALKKALRPPNHRIRNFRIRSFRR